MTGEAFVTKQFYSELGETSEPLQLSLCISPQLFTYAIFTSNFTQPLELAEIHVSRHSGASEDQSTHISQLINNYLLHQKKFQKVNICFLNQHFTIIPAAYADAVLEKELLSFATGTTASRTQSHVFGNIKLLYSINNDVQSYLERVFPNAAMRHNAAVSINLLFNHHSFNNTNVFLHLDDDYFELAIKKHQSLLFYNVFSFNSNEDILYYLLFTLEQFSIDPQTTKLAIAGQRSTQDELILTLKKYIQHVAFCVTDASVKKGGTLTNLPQHYYFTLLNQHLCEL